MEYLAVILQFFPFNCFGTVYFVRNHKGLLLKVVDHMFSSNYVWFITHRLFNHIQIHFFPEEGWYVSEIFILFTLLENQHPLASQSNFLTL